MRTCESYEIRESLCDCYGNLRLSNVFLMMQETASMDLVLYGFGREELFDKDIAFLLRRAVVEVKRMPKMNEIIEVGTSQVERQSLVYFRDFEFKSQDETLIIARTEWFLVRISDKKILRSVIDTESFSQHKVDIYYPDKPDMDFIDAKKFDSIKTAYSHIDANMHVNNTQYVVWACDAPNALGYLEKKRFSFDIFFRSEVKPSQTIDLFEKGQLVGGICEGNVSFVARFDDL